MQSTVTGMSMWSRWQPDRNLFFNSFFVPDPDGNCAIDPLPPDDADVAEIERLGGLAWIVVTNRDHLRGAAALAVRFGAKLAAGAADAPLLEGVRVDRLLHDGDFVAGARTIALAGLKTPGEFALHWPGRDTVLIGDALLGDPAGSLRLMPDDKLADPPRAVRSLRAVAAARPKHLLLGDGACLFGDATRVLWAALEARRDVYANAINVDDLALVAETDQPPGDRPHPYAYAYRDAGALIGAERLGYVFVRVEPGSTFAPMHWHTREEELFVVLAGSGTLRTPRGAVPFRARDLLAFPARASGAHQIVNTGDVPCELVLIANTDAGDVCFYPESQKLAVEASGTLVRARPQLDYYDGE